MVDNVIKVFRLSETWGWEAVEGGLPCLNEKDIFYCLDENGNIIYNNDGYCYFMVSRKDDFDENTVYVQPAIIHGWSEDE